MHETKTYDVVIVGGGVVGTALLYLLRAYTDVASIALLEKESDVGMVQSNARNNSQTLHFGDIETNYSVEKARVVNEAATMVARFLDALPKGSGIYETFGKMVLAVGGAEVEALSQRYQQFKHLFPQLQEINRERIAEMEPNVIKGRDDDMALSALYSPNGYTVNYGRLSCEFVKRAKATRSSGLDVFLNRCVESVRREGSGYVLETSTGSVRARVVVFSTGSHSLTFAKSLGLGDELIILPVAGSFFHTPKYLNGKVYTLQMAKLPFAAVHGDPDLVRMDSTRFGPTAKVIPMLERYRYKSFFSFVKLFDLRWSSIASILSILADSTYLKFVFRNVLYDLPFVGAWFFLPNIRKIVPSVRFRDVRYARGLGGIRPQVVNRKTRKVSLGESRIVGENAIFNITPSPGASTCLQAAEQDLRQVLAFFDGSYTFDEERFNQDLK